MATRISAQSIQAPLTRRIFEISGQNPNLCFQCGLCAGSCPMTGHMEVYTRRIMHMLQLGMADEAISRKMSQLCASCHTCEVRCPRGLDIPRIVEALRLATLRSGVNFIAPEAIPASTMKNLPQAAVVAGLRKLTG